MPIPTRRSDIERNLPRRAPFEDRDRVVAGRAEQLPRAAEITAHQIRRMGVGGEGRRHATPATRGEETRMRVELADRFPESCRRHLDRNAALCYRRRDGLIVESLDAVAEDLHQVRMRERVEQPAARRLCEQLEVLPPGLLHSDRVDELRLAVDPVLADEM